MSFFISRVMVFKQHIWPSVNYEYSLTPCLCYFSWLCDYCVIVWLFRDCVIIVWLCYFSWLCDYFKKWKWICVWFLLFVYNIIVVVVGDPIINRGRVEIQLTGLTLPYFCACSKPGSGFLNVISYDLFKVFFISSTNITDRHEITEILFKVAFNTINLTLNFVDIVELLTITINTK